MEISQNFVAFSEDVNFTKFNWPSQNIWTVHELSISGIILKFIYSEKATIFWEISTVDLSYVVTVKFTVEISQNFVALSEYMNIT